jgi:hypothetical protein
MSRQEAPLLADTLVTLDPGAPVEPVRARRYRHPALGERTVVRLVGETAAPGEDGALAFFGFEPPVASEPLARAPRRGLGFPQWVLLNDPARAGEALAVVKDMERAAQLARTKPGHAKDLYEVLARRLPHAHLPSFWEQAGRAFLASDRRRHAAAMFEKAREAERVYGLATGDTDRREVFLEFARAGALPAKSLASSATELRRRQSPEDAYEAFLDLALWRTRGGLPPWTALPEQVRRLGLHAGRDAAAEQERLLGELLALPATRRAPAGFWRAGRAPLIRLARASAAVRGRLLNLLPEPDHEGDFDGWWLDLLDESGALDALIQPADQVPPESAPSGGAAGWLSRFLERPQRRWWRRSPPPPQLFALVARMAPRLRADGRPVVLATDAWSRGQALDANLIDVVAEHHLPLADLPSEARIDLREWLQGGERGGVRRPLEHMAADRRFRPLVTAAIPHFLDSVQRPAEILLVSPPLDGLVRRWLEDRAAAVGQGGLVQAVRSLRELARSIRQETLRAFPRAHAALARARLAAPLARTLRGGLIDELGWPALEAAVAELEGAGPPLRSSASWPVLVIHDHVRAVAVGPGGRVAEHELRLTNPGRHDQPQVTYAGGQFLVCWRDDRRGRQVAYWRARRVRSSRSTSRGSVVAVPCMGSRSCCRTAAGPRGAGRCTRATARRPATRRTCSGMAGPSGPSSGSASVSSRVSWTHAPESVASARSRRSWRTVPSRARRCWWSCARWHRCPPGWRARPWVTVAAPSASASPLSRDGASRSCGSRASTAADWRPITGRRPDPLR